jgi:hypothetical protein
METKMWLFLREYAWLIIELLVFVGLQFWIFRLRKDKEFADLLPDGRPAVVTASCMLVLLGQSLLLRHDIDLSGPEYMMCAAGIGFILILAIGYFQLYSKARILARKVRQREREVHQNGNTPR